MNPTPTTDTQRLRELLAEEKRIGEAFKTDSNMVDAYIGAVSKLSAALRNEAPALLDEIDRLRATQEKPEINTNVRLFDLVRYMRSELHEAGLITDQEYDWLCSSPMACSPKGGSPSSERLEDYDEIRAKMIAVAAERDSLRRENEELKARLR